MYTELREKILELEGIINCKIIGKDKLEEIHIVASKGRQPKRIVRDVETLVHVNLDREIDHKKISIARVNKKKKTHDRDRIKINSIYREHNRPVVHFKLEINDGPIEEEVRGSKEEPLPLIVARGMTEIITDYTEINDKLRVDNVFTTGINNDDIVIVQISLYRDGNLNNEDKVLGAVYINHDLPLATGKACLKALNRII